MVERTGFFVYYKDYKVIKSLKNLVNIKYVSKKNNYLFAYCDAKRFEGIKKTILQQKLVRGVEQSHLDMDHLTFDELFSPTEGLYDLNTELEDNEVEELSEVVEQEETTEYEKE